MLELVKAAVFGVVEGITEWLPISSTGHMILLDEFLKLNCGEEFWNLFLVVIQLGAIAAVVLLYWDKIFPFQFQDSNKPVVDKDIIILWLKIVVACIPAAIIGILFDDTIDALFYHPVPVALALIIFGILFLIVENYNKGRHAKIRTLKEISFQTAVLIGVFQVLAAVFPGTSRSGATIIGALLIGVSRTIAAEFTFFLAIPVMLGASLLKVVKYGLPATGMEYAILAVGMLVAFVVSVLIIKFLMSYIKKNDFKAFGWYRIVLGILVLVYFHVK